MCNLSIVKQRVSTYLVGCEIVIAKLVSCKSTFYPLSFVSRSTAPFGLVTNTIPEMRILRVTIAVPITISATQPAVTVQVYIIYACQ